MGNEEILAPLELRQAGERTLAIRWQDGHESFYESLALRRACRCAGCVDEWSGESRIHSQEIPEDIHPIQIEGVGRYGIRIQWSDGHSTGIYTFKYLREICGCAKCRS